MTNEKYILHTKEININNVGCMPSRQLGSELDNKFQVENETLYHGPIEG